MRVKGRTSLNYLKSKIRSYKTLSQYTNIPVKKLKKVVSGKANFTPGQSRMIINASRRHVSQVLKASGYSAKNVRKRELLSLSARAESDIQLRRGLAGKIAKYYHRSVSRIMKGLRKSERFQDTNYLKSYVKQFYGWEDLEPETRMINKYEARKVKEQWVVP